MITADLVEGFDLILVSPEAHGDWSVARTQPGKIVPGEPGYRDRDSRADLRLSTRGVNRVGIQGKTLVARVIKEVLRVK